MTDLKIGEQIQTLRKSMGYTQKAFAEFLDIPQPSLSAYENNKNSPTIEVLINIAKRCNISLDWLCGLTTSSLNISTMGNVVDFLFQLKEIDGLNLELTIHDKLQNDMETETDRWYTSITVYGNECGQEHNSSFCNALRKVRDITADLESFAIPKETYIAEKNRVINYYSRPLKKAEIPDLSREERIKRHMDYLNKLNGLI